MPIETKIASVGKSYSALDFQADDVACANGGAKLYKRLDNIEIIAVSRDLSPHTRHIPNSQQHIFCLALIYRQSDFLRLPLNSTKRAVTSRIVRPMMSISSAYAGSCTLVENSAIAMHFRLP